MIKNFEASKFPCQSNMGTIVDDTYLKYFPLKLNFSKNQRKNLLLRSLLNVTELMNCAKQNNLCGSVSFKTISLEIISFL